MVYIVVIATPGIKDSDTEYIYNNKIKAFTVAKQYVSCHGCELDIKVYDAINEYTNKRHLLKQYWY